MSEIGGIWRGQNMRYFTLLVVGTIVLASTALLFLGKTATLPANDTVWPTNGWATAARPASG
jgi:hypothetical protein